MSIFRHVLLIYMLDLRFHCFRRKKKDPLLIISEVAIIDQVVIINVQKTLRPVSNQNANNNKSVLFFTLFHPDHCDVRITRCLLSLFRNLLPVRPLLIVPVHLYHIKFCKRLNVFIGNDFPIPFLTILTCISTFTS
ncbi:hypothetical protein PHET_05011 [Paragonimus heterotremus]|uniref:Uncharacterized protein n=1 Tax=Paragonimus heterotremus TaxID=100268 RepID=A0A8J4SPS5_9TREM|nr:hypothetical protein PHET_05011 [Paragonimus heterotremus]